MNAHAMLELPLDAPQFTPSAQYLRLFGSRSPEQVMTGVPLPATPPNCDPRNRQAAGHLLSAIDTIALMRARQRAKGFTPQADAQERGPLWFWHGIHEFWWKAMDAGENREARRKAKAAAAALIVASMEADDFLTQQEATSER